MKKEIKKAPKKNVVKKNAAKKNVKDTPKKKRISKEKKSVKKLAFTLIELLAVIVILGVLMLIAIPSVTNYINDSRKDVYVDTVKNYIKGATHLVNSGELDVYDPGATYYIPSSCIGLETGGNSPFGEFDPAYIIVTYDNNTFNYFYSWGNNNFCFLNLLYYKI